VAIGSLSAAYPAIRFHHALNHQAPAFDGLWSLFLHCVFERVFERVFETADGILNLAFGVIGLSFGLQLCITYRFADGLFD
jgi:hypothetical protein